MASTPATWSSGRDPGRTMGEHVTSTLEAIAALADLACRGEIDSEETIEGARRITHAAEYGACIEPPATLVAAIHDARLTPTPDAAIEVAARLHDWAREIAPRRHSTEPARTVFAE